MKTRLLPHPLLTLALWAMWLLLNNTLAMGHVVLGLILAILIPLLSQRFWSERICIHQPLTLLRFIGIVMRDILVANITVARWVLGSNNKLQPAWLNIPLDIQSPLGISLLANTISLTPGTVACDLSADQRSLLVHALHVEDTATAIAEMKSRYEQPLMEVFRSC
jgi:multicomponent K+:H+ antiporter subunit E